MQIDILAEGEGWLAVGKPAGLPVVPARTEQAPCLKEILQQNYHQRLWVVHRLDAETSGVLLLARNARVHRELCLQFERRRVEKHYLCLVYGLPEKERWICRLPIGPGRKGKMRIGGAAAKPSRTDFELLWADSQQRRSLLLARPLTGRRHQIRLHLAAAGHPVVGERLYLDAARVLAGFDARQCVDCQDGGEGLALHAWRIRFLAPVSGTTVEIETARPPWAPNRPPPG